MVPPFIRPRRLRPRLYSWLCGILLGVMASLVPVILPAQITNPPEVSSRDVEPTFKLQSERNLVMVRVVVRDAKGATVDNLRKEDFELYDHGKMQTISHFSLENPGLKASEPAPKPAEKAAEPDVEEETARPASAAQRFVALYFDDVNTTFEGIVRARDAADHFLAASVQPGDRVALFTSSGQMQVDFTSDLTQIHRALLELRQRPIAGQDTSSCITIPPYEAYLIVAQNDSLALADASLRALSCETCPMDDPQSAKACFQNLDSEAQNEANRFLMLAETEARTALRGIEAVVRRMAVLPGQRSIIIVSTGFFTETLHYDLGQIADRALRANVILNALDARGLYTDPQVAPVSPHLVALWASAHPQQLLSGALTTAPRTMAVEDARRQTDGMQDLALDTGGLFFNNSNDLGEGFRKLMAAPEAFYVLAFSPQNLKLDGAFHPLQVKLVSRNGFSVQARKGYYAPKKPNDPAEQAKEELHEAVLSREETHELPVDVHTKFFMKTESDARVSVVTHVDLRPLHLHKETDRSVENLTFVTAMFDQDGHVVSVLEKAVDLHLSDATMERYLQTGITIQTAFDVKPGTYLVRAIVRDSDSAQISSLNRTVQIPF
jgi:VWFA-related protein